MTKYFSDTHKKNISIAKKGKPNLKLRGKNHPRWNRKLKNQVCEQCKSMFNSDRLRKFCSNKCRYKSQSGKEPTQLQKNRGIKPRTYYLKTNKYGSAEAREWRKRVFERDGYTCQICKIRGGKLNAHHILPFSKYPSERFNVNNGLTLCLKCHSKTDSFGWKNYWKNYLAQRRINQTVELMF